MYQKILVPLENSSIDGLIIDHVSNLAKFCKAKLILVHVADGFVARNQNTLNLADSEEMQVDRAYLESKASELREKGLEVDAKLLCGEPAAELLKLIEREKCDLIAMATHGHRLLADLILGSVADNIRHRTSVPVLMLRA